jgi:hypothetical protein
MLRRGYLEIVSAVEGMDTALAREQRAAVARRVGAHLLAFAVADVAAARARLASEGFDPLEPVPLGRQIAGPESTNEAAFSVLRVPPDRMPEGRVQLLVHETPDLVWRSEFLTGLNGTLELSGVLVCVPDAREAAERYARFVGALAVGNGEYATVTLDRGRLGFGTVECCARLLRATKVPHPSSVAAVSLASDHVEVTRHQLAERGIPIVDERGSRFSTRAETTLGTSLVIHSMNEVWPPDFTHIPRASTAESAAPK